MRVVVFGANGPTGRVLCARAAGAGHEVVAVTRNPGRFPVAGVVVRGADVRDAGAVEGVLRGADAVLSVLGVPFSREVVETYSVGVGSIVEGMLRHGVRRVAAVTSSALAPDPGMAGGLFFRRVLQPYVVERMGRTLYADMRRSEEILAGSGLEWTVVRPSGLFSAGRVSAYQVAEGHQPSRFTAREDLADLLLRQVTDDTWVGRAVAVGTVEGTPGIARLLWREAIRKSA